ncbi:MAG TPA: carotenoid oxygenase family protein [Burkholderiaceae bacterium]|nr:carotenoid oxygenase family protein [Burkholderiaceae bacterium]
MSSAVLADSSDAIRAAPQPAQGRRRGFLSVQQECDGIDLRVQGRLPEWLVGTYVLNGPAQWELPKRSYAHWFDGLAMLHGFRIQPGRVHYRNRFLRSQDWRESHANGRPQLGGYDTAPAGGLLSRIVHMFNPRRSDNGCVVAMHQDGQWFALTESDRVMRFDGQTLDTQGEVAWTEGGKLPLLAAHPCIDAQGRWWNVGVSLGRECEYVLFSCDVRGHRAVKARIPVKRAGYLHAFAMTATHTVIWECAWRAHPLRFLFAGESYARHFDWMPEGGSRLHTVRLSDGAVRSWDAPPLVLFHASQAFDAGGDVVVDLCLNDEPVVEELHIARLRAGMPVTSMLARHARFVLSPGASTAREEALPGRFELPQVNARVATRGAARYVWGATTADSTPGEFFNRTLRLDLQTGEMHQAGRDDAFALEPLFVPNPNGIAEDDGVLLVHTLADDDPGSRIRVLDAATLDERAAIELPHVIPFGFHGAWLAVRPIR